jgi:hypothetical protein
MHSLKREVVLPARPFSNLLLIGCLCGIVSSLLTCALLVSVFGHPTAGRTAARTYECGITAPLDCVLSIFVPTAQKAHETVEAVVEAPALVVHMAQRAMPPRQRNCGHVMTAYYEQPVGTLTPLALLAEVNECRAHYRASGID